MYQIDEKLMADNRSIISINSSKANIDRVLKSGMINYVTNEHNDLYLTTPRSKNYGEYNRLIQEEADGKIPYDLVFKGNVVIEQNLSILGETTTIDTPNLSIEDNIIEINRNESGSGITLGSAGIQANRGIKGNANWLFSEITDKQNIGAFVFDVNGNAKAWIYEDGNLKVLNGFDTQSITARNDIYGMTNLTIDQNTLLKGLLNVNSAATLNSTLSVTGGTTLKNSLDVTGAAWLKSTLKTDGIATFNNALYVIGNYATTLGGALTTTGATLLKNKLNVNGATDLDSTLNVNGATTLQTTLTAIGATWLKDTLKVDKAATFNNTLLSVGNATFNNPVQMDMTLHTVGSVDFDSTLNVDGITTLQNALNVKGLTTIDGNDLHIKYDAMKLTGGKLTVDKHAEFNADVNIDSFLTVGGTLGVTGATTLSNALTVNLGTLLKNTLTTVGATSLQDTLTVTGLTRLNNNLITVGPAQFNNTLTADMAALFKDAVTINGTLTINSLNISGGVKSTSDLSIGGNATIGGTLSVGDIATFNNTVDMMFPVTTWSTLTSNGAAILNDALTVTGATLLKSTLGVTGSTTLNGALNAIGTASIGSTLQVTGATTLKNTLNVQMAADFDSTVNIDGNLTGSTATFSGAVNINTLTLNGVSTFKNDVTVNAKLTATNIVTGVLGATGATTLGSTLTVTGGSTLNNTLDVVGASWLKSTLKVDGLATLNNALTVVGNIAINNASTKLLEGEGNSIRLQTDIGYVDIGPKNASFAHFGTDRPEFHFSKPLKVQGEIYAGTAYDKKVWHEGNFDPTAKSNSNHTHSIATTAANGFMSAADKSKLDDIAAGAGQYEHPATHPYSMITGTPTSLPANGGNADTVDGKHAADFAVASHTHNYAGSSTAGGAATTALVCTGNAATATTATTANQIQGIACDKTATAPTGTTRLNIQAYLYATRVYNAVYNDYAEYFEKGETTEPGDLIMIDINSDEERYIKTDEAYSKNVIGVHSDSFGQCLGGKGDGQDDENYIPIGLAGRVRVKMVGSCKKGQFVVSSSMPGVAMAIDEKDYKLGTVIGKALEDCDGSNGIERVKILICKM